VAITNETLQISVKIEGEKAASALKTLGKNLDEIGKDSKTSAKGITDLNKSVKSFVPSIIAVNQALELASKAMRTITGITKSLVTAYNQQEAAERKLANALRLRGGLTENNINRLKTFTAELQRNSTVGDEVSLNLASQAIAMGKSLDQTEKLIKASAELAAVTGKDIDSAFRMLNQTYAGTTQSLTRLGIQVPNFTKEQLAAGAAVEWVNKQLDGSAKALTGTLSGALQQATNAWGDLKEELGGLLVEVVKLDKVIIGITNLIVKLSGFVSNLRDTFKQLAIPLNEVISLLSSMAIVIGARLLLQYKALIKTTIIYIATSKALLAVLAAKLKVLAVLSLKFVAFVAIAAAVDIAIRNIGLITDWVKRGFYEFLIVINNLIGMLGKAISAFGVFNRSLQRTGKELEALANRNIAGLQNRIQKLKDEPAKFDAGITGRLFDFIRGKSRDTDEKLKETKDNFGDLKDALSETGFASGAFTKTLGDLDATLDKFEALKKSVFGLGVTISETAMDNYQSRQKELKSIVDVLKEHGKYKSMLEDVKRMHEGIARGLVSDSVKALSDEMSSAVEFAQSRTELALGNIQKEYLEHIKTLRMVQGEVGEIAKAISDNTNIRPDLKSSLISQINDVARHAKNLEASVFVETFDRLQDRLTEIQHTIRDITKSGSLQLEQTLDRINAERDKLTLLEAELALQPRALAAQEQMLVKAR
jgi:NTP pyrophosphatase (non-canonical NTP hydrolase)